MIRIKYLLIIFLSLNCHVFGQNFNANVLCLLDENERTYLFRGNIPECNGEFCEDALRGHIKDYLRSYQRSISKDFKLIIVSFLNTFTSKKECGIEAKWFLCHPEKGFLWRYPLFGYGCSPECIPKSLRKLFYWTDVDGLNHLMHQLKRLVDFDYEQDTVIYIHCNVGKDRTGEASACYLMRYKGYSYAEAMALNHEIARRRLRLMSVNAIRWYAYYLQEVCDFQTIGKVH